MNKLVAISEAAWRKLKHASTDRDKTMKEILEELIEEFC